MALDVSSASMAELQAEFVRLGGELAVLANQRHAIAQEVDRRVKGIQARERLGRMSEEDRAALRVALDSQ